LFPTGAEDRAKDNRLLRGGAVWISLFPTGAVDKGKDNRLLRGGAV
jgi:hypothetical protein